MKRKYKNRVRLREGGPKGHPPGPFLLESCIVNSKITQKNIHKTITVIKDEYKSIIRTLGVRLLRI